MTHTISDNLWNQLVMLREKKGSITLENLGQILGDIASIPEGDDSGVDILLRKEILAIANYIETTRNEIAALAPKSASAQSQSSETIQLNAVIKATGDAAYSIMDAADEIQNILGGSDIDQPSKEKITAVTTKLYEACNFQDLTTQRITKVILALEFTETRIALLAKLFTEGGTINMEELRKTAANDTNAHLLNGPQLSGEAPSQTDIDALFSALK